MLISIRYVSSPNIYYTINNIYYTIQFFNIQFQPRWYVQQKESHCFGLREEVNSETETRVAVQVIGHNQTDGLLYAIYVLLYQLRFPPPSKWYQRDSSSLKLQKQFIETLVSQLLLTLFQGFVISIQQELIAMQWKVSLQNSLLWSFRGHCVRQTRQQGEARSQTG